MDYEDIDYESWRFLAKNPDTSKYLSREIIEFVQMLILRSKINNEIIEKEEFDYFMILVDDFLKDNILVEYGKIFTVYYEWIEAWFKRMKRQYY